MPSPPPPWRRARCACSHSMRSTRLRRIRSQPRGQPLSRFPTPRRPSRRLRAHGETVSRAASSASPGPRARPPRRTSCATCSSQPAACAPRRATRTTSSASPTPCWPPRPTRETSSSRWACAVCTSSKSCAGSCARNGALSPTSAKATSSFWAAARTSRAPKRSSSRRCLRAAWRSSTPQTI